MMSNISNSSSLVCPTIAWTPQPPPRSCMDMSNPIGFRAANMMTTTSSTIGQSVCSGYAGGSFQGGGTAGVGSGSSPSAAHSVGGTTSPPAAGQLRQFHVPSPRHSPPSYSLPPAAPLSPPNSSSMGWMSSPLNHGPPTTSASPSTSPTSNHMLPPPPSSSSTTLQRSQTMPLVMLPISMGTAQPVYENRQPMMQPIAHRPSPPQSGPCYYQNFQHHSQLSPYPHAMMLGHEAPVSQRERTKPLRDWILKHRTHPYPTKEDKLALAMMTRMRLDQVSMWFANTRRQIRKVGMKAWSGGLFCKPLPNRVGNGAIIPVPEDERFDSMEDESSMTCSSDDDSSGRIPTDSSCSMD